MRERVLNELNAARQEGVHEGIEIGESRDRTAGRIGMLARLLQLKFGPLAQVTQQRLEQADEASLELWTERVLSAQSLQEVFA